MTEYIHRGEPLPIVKSLTAQAGIPASLANRIARERDVKINGVRIRKDSVAIDGDRVTAYTPDRPKESRLTQFLLYEDDAVAVLDKPVGYDIDRVLQDFALDKKEYFAVHRLDRNTTGLLILAKTAEAERELSLAFRERRVKKIYSAHVLGVVKNEEAEETAYLDKDSEAGFVTVSGTRKENSLTAITRYRVVSRQKETTVLSVEPLTGRTHQIRAHLAYLGYPVLGDGKYGNRAENKRLGFSVQQLCCVSLGFTFPSESALAYLDGREFFSDQTRIAARAIRSDLNQSPFLAKAQKWHLR